MKSKIGLRIKKGEPYPFGVSFCKNSVNFSLSLPEFAACCLNLYRLSTGECLDTIYLDKEYKTGHVFAVRLEWNRQKCSITNVSDFSDLAFEYQAGEKAITDPYTFLLYGRDQYGLNSRDTKLLSGFPEEDYPWKEEGRCSISYTQLIIYKLHVRGFTIHPSSEVKHKGTFLGISEKIPYLKELGINSILLMPAYEYNETLTARGIGGKEKLNYWGYSEDNLYFAPKASYAFRPHQVMKEFKDMVQAIHNNGMEVFMEMNFAPGTNSVLIQECLRHWVRQYHIDGFRLVGDGQSVALAAADPLLGNIKLMTESWEGRYSYEAYKLPVFKNLSEYNQGFSVTVKRFLRSEEGQVEEFSKRFLKNPEQWGVVNYITNHDGFTLMDLVSYDIRHNEANGEKNLDGMEYNYSWNCGKEGVTKNKKIVALRRKQIRNALTLLFLSQGTPLILAGDEFGNSQQGNNNAYCQDNDLSWLDWDILKNTEDIFHTVQKLIQIRKEHPVFRMEQQPRCIDYMSCGFSDVSFHGVVPWVPDYSFYSRVLGIHLAGHYVMRNRQDKDNCFYIAINFHWEVQSFKLPPSAPGTKWYIYWNTEEEQTLTMLLENQGIYQVPSRTVIIFISK
ncbi:glycogen operon protein GlgX homolog [Anaerocolumna cellulosilytica]|uniref:Glycogen operon protein GlgX homolog n=1 Tax=Anaerocolumna cellulosilytica TaxID=433286 RepID=A0A6S6R354_9FIRM|nr:alpha-amylase family glycosyl hydrolase [Anaerocolumna cellulosilytica]MBB5196838.1 glycogen operon protein [Anaerocolumna cellulosilytica]BCJ95769.1 glycogen operon protein GlgX homolog [Anaerocolumna cellulosilytica]